MDVTRLHTLVESYLDERSSTEEQSELEALLRAYPEARERYWEEIWSHMELRSAIAVAAGAAEKQSAWNETAPEGSQAREREGASPRPHTIPRVGAPGVYETDMTVSRGPLTSFIRGVWRFVLHQPVASSVAATLVLYVVLGALLVVLVPLLHNGKNNAHVSRTYLQQSAPSSGDNHSRAPHSFTARLVRTHDAQWGQGGRNGERGTGNAERGTANRDRAPETLQDYADLYPGDRLYLKRGLAEIQFATGAVVVLEGPARFSIDGANFCGLSLGKLVARVESESAKGFTVETPTATITDLGTEFGVEVERSGKANTHVFRGVIQIAQATKVKGGTDRPPPTRLTAGQTAAIGGGRVMIERTDDKKFVTTRLPERKSADGSIIVYQENFDAFAIGPISGQRGWTSMVGDPQVVVGDTGGAAGHVVTGSNSGGGHGSARQMALYSLPANTSRLIFKGRMRLRSQFGNRVDFVDRGGNVIVGFGTGYGGFDFVVVDGSDTKLFSGNAPGGNALSPSGHAWYAVTFTVDFHGGGKATGTFAVRKDGQAGIATLASGLDLQLDPLYEDPTKWTGLLLNMRTLSDQQDSIELSYMSTKPAVDL